MNTAILAPGAVLILWSVVMMFWMFITRFPAMSKLKLTKDEMVGARGRDLDERAPGKAHWAAHNYEHLMEQPTIFYPVIVILAVVGGASDFSVVLAWLYVLMRIMHSVWQATINLIPVRFALFLLSSTCLAILAIQAVIVTTA